MALLSIAFFLLVLAVSIYGTIALLVQNAGRIGAALKGPSTTPVFSAGNASMPARQVRQNARHRTIRRRSVALLPLAA